MASKTTVTLPAGTVLQTTKTLTIKGHTIESQGTVTLGEEVEVEVGARPDQGLPGGGAGGSGNRPDNSLPGGQGGRPDNSLPGSQPGVDNTLPGQGGRPDNSLPGSQPGVDNTLPGSGARPDQGLPPTGQPKK